MDFGHISAKKCHPHGFFFTFPWVMPYLLMSIMVVPGNLSNINKNVIFSRFLHELGIQDAKF